MLAMDSDTNIMEDRVLIAC